MERDQSRSRRRGTSVASARTSVLYQRERQMDVTEKMLRLIEAGREGFGYIGMGTERPSDPATEDADHDG